MAIWTLAKIKQEIRDITGRKTTNQMTDAKLEDYLNEYYTLIMPLDLNLEGLEDFWSKDTTASVETVSLDSNVLYLRKPFTIAGYPLHVVDDPAHFYNHYPKFGESYTPARPNLALYQGRSLLLRPTPDDAYEIYAPAVIVPAAMTTGPAEDAWGRMIALGTAILIYASFGQRDQAKALQGPYEYQRALVQRPTLMKMQDYRGQGRF